MRCFPGGLLNDISSCSTESIPVALPAELLDAVGRAVEGGMARSGTPLSPLDCALLIALDRPLPPGG